jgi:deazaflavin-dependent oxidoreductase (nitroreductase family)
LADDTLWPPLNLAGEVVTLADLATRSFLRLHQGLYERTDGRLGHRLIGVPSLILRTTGRRSGRTRAAVLAYAVDAGRYVVVASNGGQDRPPAWLHNAATTSLVEVQVGRRRTAATAAVVEAGDAEYARLWELVNRMNSGRYDAYQRRTDRAIALVAIAPVAEGADPARRVATSGQIL